MKLFGKFSFFLNIIFWTGIAAAEGPKAEDPAAFNSFLSYSPRASQFPAALKTVALPLEGKDFQSALDAAKAVQPKLNRSFEDQLWFLRGLAYAGLGDDKSALDSFDRALKIRPNNLLALFQHALLLKKNNKCAKAIPELKEIAWQVKELAYEMRYLTGECLVVLGQPEEAMKQYEAAYKQNPTYLPVLREMIRAREELLAKTANPQERTVIEAQLSADLNNLNREHPDDRDSTLQLTKLLLNVTDPLLESGKLERAETLAKKMADDSNWKDSEFVRLLAQAQIKRGALDEAEATLARGLKAKPDSKELKEEREQLHIERTVKSEQDEAAEEKDGKN